MTDLTPVATLSPVPQLETTDRALGGTGNPMNRQAQALLNRDAFRAQQIADAKTAANGYTDTLRQDLADATDPANGAGMVGFDPALLYLGGTVGSALVDLQTIPANEILLVPSQFATIQAACEEVVRRRYDMGVTVEVRLETGYQIPSGIDIRNSDLRNVRITSVDATVTLAPGFVGVIVSTDPFATDAIFYGENAHMPELSCLIDAADVGGPGYCVNQNSIGKVSGACGVVNAGKYGLYVVGGSKCFATQANFSLANWGNRVTTNSTLCAPQINCSGAKLPTYSGSNTTAAMDVSRGSVVYITGTPGAETNLTNSAGVGLGVRRSFVSATSVDVSGAGADGVRAQSGAWVSFVASIADNCTVDGIGVYASWIDASGGVSAINAGRYGIIGQDGAKVCARNAILTGAGTNGVNAAQGSDVNVNGANCWRNGVSDQATDIVTGFGSIIHAVSASGGTNITPLTLSASGLIFK